MPITFITNAQFLVRYDRRWVGKNMLDDGMAATEADLLDTGTVAGARLEQLIQEASELVMAAGAVGARYSVNDLVTYGGQLLVRIVSDLTVGLILKRRARALTDENELSGPYAEAMGYLEQLRRGGADLLGRAGRPGSRAPRGSHNAPDPRLPTPHVDTIRFTVVREHPTAVLTGVTNGSRSQDSRPDPHLRGLPDRDQHPEREQPGFLPGDDRRVLRRDVR